MYMPNSFFKARFLRPISIQNKTAEWTDAQDVIQQTAVFDLIKINDWRGYAIGNGFSDANKLIDGQFYGIKDSTEVHYWVDMAEIRTDHRLGTEGRTKLTDVSAIEALEKASEFESLRKTYLFLSKENEFTVKIGNANKKVKNVLVLNYRNNEANVGTFHLYVPIYVTYSFGEFDYNGTGMYGAGGSASPMMLKSTSKDDNGHFNYATGNWANADLYTPFLGHRTDGDAKCMGQEVFTADATSQLKATAPLYTQKVWATIVVKQTTNSGSQSGARNK